MIDERTEHIYNIILSIFLGALSICLITVLFDKPRIVDIYIRDDK
jgi:hypothetical protein